VGSGVSRNIIAQVSVVNSRFTVYMDIMSKKLTKNQAAYQALLTKFSKACIADMAGVSRQALTKWKSVPPNRVAAIAEKSGWRPEEILPEPYASE
jgi:hypothetical protein